MAATAAHPQKDSMKSTWRSKPEEWNSDEKQLEYFALHPTSANRQVPVHEKTDKLQYLPHWQAHFWVLYHALWPPLLHQIYVWYFGYNMNHVFVMGLYTGAFMVNAVHQLWMMRDLGHNYGYLDGDKHQRDQIPDGGLEKAMRGLSLTIIIRVLLAVTMTYTKKQTPLNSLKPITLIFEIGFYGITLDFWFYWYHRCMHEINALWKYHRTHHLTKHPTPLLTIWADDEQEIFDIAVIPMLTFFTMKFLFGFPMGFFDWWICHEYVVFTELFGHSGVRMYVTPPTTATWFLAYFDAELLTEDHDLHHRIGYRQSHNYGKQTLLWDRVFGTNYKRIESTKENVDWETPGTMTMFYALPILGLLNPLFATGAKKTSDAKKWRTEITS